MILLLISVSIKHVPHRNDIHHELPIKYGGTNSMSNLFPLPKDIHQKEVSPWWASY